MSRLGGLIFVCLLIVHGSDAIKPSNQKNVAKKTPSGSRLNRGNTTQLDDVYPAKTMVLADPEDCIRSCMVRLEHPSLLTDSTFQSFEEAEMRRACMTSQTRQMCRNECPVTMLRDVADVIYDPDADTNCEPTMNWDSFQEYSDADKCIKRIRDELSCDNKCGSYIDVKSISDHKLIFYPSNVTVEYPGDTDRNTVAIRNVCKGTECRLHCVKPTILDRCGRQAYSMHVRMIKAQTNAALSVLRAVSAVDLIVKECNLFRR